MPDNKNAIDIAKITLQIANEKEIQLNNFKLQAILYFGQCESYIRTGRPLISSSFSATSFGIIQQEVFNHFNVNGMCPISLNTETLPFCDTEDANTISDTLDKYGSFSCWDLFDAIREQQSWKSADEARNQFVPNPLISNLLIA